MLVDYEVIEEAGTLSARIQGNRLDLYSMGVFQLNLQEIVDKVAFALLTREDVYFPRPRLRQYRRMPSSYFDYRVVRADVKSISVGSLAQDIAFWVPAVLADPNVRDVLQGLAANIVYAIGASGVRGIVLSGSQKPRESLRRFSRPPDVDVGDNVRAIVVILAENGGGELSFRSETPRGGINEVTIRVNSRQ